jgi:VCBS repeat protein
MQYDAYCRGYATQFSPMCSADFNADGKPDLAVLYSNNQIAILLGNGTGSFGAPTAYTINNSDPVCIVSIVYKDSGVFYYAQSKYDSATYIESEDLEI